jgi:hypothetical protein
LGEYYQRNLPIFMAAVFQRSAALCGEIADAPIVSNMRPPGYTKHAATIIREPATAVGGPARAGVGEVAQLCWADPADDIRYLDAFLSDAR